MSKTKKIKKIKKMFDLHGRIEIREDQVCESPGGNNKEVDVITARYHLNKHLEEMGNPPFHLFTYKGIATEIGCTVCTPPDGIKHHELKMKLWTFAVSWEGGEPYFHIIYKPNLCIDHSYYTC